MILQIYIMPMRFRMPFVYSYPVTAILMDALNGLILRLRLIRKSTLTLNSELLTIADQNVWPQ